MNNFKIDLDNTIDEDFFGSLKDNKSSKLHQLFAEDSLSSEDKQQSLKYQRPKDIATQSNATSTTTFAKVVTAYKQGEVQGKVGLALIQNADRKCNIIIYKSKAHILITLELQPEKNVLYKQRMYWQFYDNDSLYWSFSFNNKADEEEFVKKLSIHSITYTESNEKEHITEKPPESAGVSNETQNCDVDVLKPVIATRETKNSLLKRMAKMGKPLPTVPFSNQQGTGEFSDSSDAEVITTPLASHQKSSITSKLATNNLNQELVPSYVGQNSISSAVYSLNPLESQYMQMLLTEQRTQGSELRMNMNKLENKMEKVLDKLDFYDRKDGKEKPEKDDEILELEEKILMLKKENRRLKQNLIEKSSKVSSEDNLRQLLYEFKDDLNEFDIDYQQDLKKILTELSYKLKNSHHELKRLQQKNEEHEQKLAGITEFELNIRKRENELKQQLNENEAEILKQKHEILDLKHKLQERSQEVLTIPNDTFVKSIMNNLYMDIADKLNNINIPHSEQILSLMASSIKEQTLKSLQQSKAA